MSTPAADTESRERIHLPPPSAIPLLTGIGLAVLVVGLISNWAVTATGGIILFVSILRWIADVKRSYDRLPE